jgi:hypothetical protein
MEGTLPGIETSPEDGPTRPEAARKSEAGLRGILPREDIPPKAGMSPTEDNPEGGIPPRTEEIRPVLILGPTPSPDRTGGHPLDRTTGPIGISRETDPSLDRALSPTGLRADPLPGEKGVPVTSPPLGAGLAGPLQRAGPAGPALWS